MVKKTTSNGRRAMQSLLLFCVILFGIVSTLGSFHDDDDDDDEVTIIGNDNDTGDGGLTTTLPLTFNRGLPLYLSYKDGDSGSWQEVDVTQPSVGINISDTSGFFSLLTVCDYRDEIRAYLLKTSLTRFNSDFIDCDDTNGKTTYSLSGTIGYPGDTYIADLSFTNNFRDNWYSLTTGANSNSAYNVQVELDDDEETNVDLYYRVFTFGQFHNKIVRGVDLTTNPTIDYTAVASDVGVAFNPDVSSYSGLSDYAGLSGKIDLSNSKVRVYEDDTSANPSFEKLPASQQMSDDIYITYAVRENIVTGGIQGSKLFKLRNNPDSSLSFDEVPNYLPTLSLSSSVTDMIRVQYDTAYDNGLTGMDDAWRRLTLSNTAITWKIYHSSDRFDDNITIPNEATGFGNWSASWNVLDSDLQRLTHYATTSDKVSTLTDYLASGRQADADDDGLDFVQVTWRWAF